MPYNFQMGGEKFYEIIAVMASVIAIIAIILFNFSRKSRN